MKPADRAVDRPAAFIFSLLSYQELVKDVVVRDPDKLARLVGVLRKASRREREEDSGETTCITEQ